MSMNKDNAYNMDAYVAEIYDQFETEMDDVALLRKLLAGRNRLRILEPFFGTGRIAIPLAQDGHQVTGIERSTYMIERARSKIAELSEETAGRITILEGDVLVTHWPVGFDLVLLGGNCFYELGSGDEQERCIALARASLKPDGHVYVDNNHMEGELDVSWRQPPGMAGKSFPQGTCTDGTQVQGTTEMIWYDVPGRLVRYRRTVTVTTPDGKVTRREWMEQCHPPSKVEVASWLEKHGFKTEELYGDRLGNPYTDDSGRAIFWATRE